MATNVDVDQAAARPRGRGYMADQDYFTRFTIVLALFIIFGFAQFSMRGFVDVRSVSLLTHLHAVFMVGWLGVAVAQNMLVQRGDLHIHRRLGWLAAALVAGIAVLGVNVGVSAVAGQRVPPFFSNSYFLALTMIEPVVFAAVVAWGVSLRRKTQWHRRAMLGAMIIILEPALGRLLPMPLMNGWGEPTILALQLVALGVLGLHDRKVLGHIHPATLIMMAVITVMHVTISGISNFGPFSAAAEALAGG